MAEITARYGLDRLSPDDWSEIIATYYGMVSRVDEQLGRVLAAVDRAGAGESTVTAFFTDHGEYLGDYGLVEKWPSGVNPCLLRNPLVLAGPGIFEGEVSSHPTEMIDLFATLLDLGEIEPAHTHFGRNLLTGAPREAAFAEGGFNASEEPLLETASFPYDLKAALQHDDPESVGRAIVARTAQWTYVYRLYEGAELYERSGDPGELDNLAGVARFADVEQAMRERVLRWSVETSDVIPWEPDARNP